MENTDCVSYLHIILSYTPKYWVFMHLIGVHIIVYSGLTERTIITRNRTQSRGIRLPDQHFFPRIQFYSHGETVFHRLLTPRRCSLQTSSRFMSSRKQWLQGQLGHMVQKLIQQTNKVADSTVWNGWHLSTRHLCLTAYTCSTDSVSKIQTTHVICCYVNRV